MVEERAGVKSGWVTRRIREVGRVVTGKTPSTKDPGNFGGQFPFITIPDLDGRVSIDQTERTLSEKGAETIKTSLLPPGAVLMSCIATVGKCGITAKPSFTNQQINSVIPEDGTDARFLYYVFTQLSQQMQSVGSGGSVYTNVSKSRFSNIEISLPALSEQRAIAHVLGTLDDKIELNRRINETLEEMARALFKSWFVDFEPMRAKMEGRWRRGESLPGMPAELYDLFPGRLVGSEVGEVPEGWRVRALDNIANFLNGLALQKYPANDGPALPVIKIAQLRAGHTDGADSADANIPSQYVVHDGDVLFSWSGSLELSVWAGGDGALNQHLFKVSSGSYPVWLYYHWIGEYLPAFRDIAADKATTMGHIQKRHLSQAMTVVPNPPLLDAMSYHMRPFMDCSLTLRLESRALAAQRDALLPNLVSGEVRLGSPR